LSIIWPGALPELTLHRHLGTDYEWPGNIRELEQCLRNILIRRSYAPSRQITATKSDAYDELLADIAEERLTADELLRRYCTLVYAGTSSYEATARKLQLDRRTVRAKVDAALLERIKGRTDDPRDLTGVVGRGVHSI
jgi:DNA-binding NtrC family response regulator